MASSPPEVVVVGAGIIGSFTAYRLAGEGVPVTLIEREDPGGMASRAAAGNVQAWPFVYGRLEAELGSESLALWRSALPAIKSESGIDTLDHEVPFLYPAFDEVEVDDLRARAGLAVDAGLHVKWIDGSEARDLEPRLSPRVVGAVLHQDFLQLDAHSAVTALVEAAKARGAQVIQAEAAGLEIVGGTRGQASRVTGVRLRDGAVLPCSAVILAMGAWMGVAVPQWLGIPFPTLPCPLQKLHIRIRGRPLACGIRGTGINIVPRMDGLNHVGSRHDDTSGFEANPTAEGRRWILERVGAALPSLEYDVVEAGAGCAAKIPDHVPIIGPLDSCEGVYVAATDDDGFHLSAIISHILTELVVKGKTHPMLLKISPRARLKSS